MPGVPPDAANIVKRVFKGIFKRGKKTNQDEASTPTSTPPTQQSQSPAAPSQSAPPPVDTKAPQLPPIGNASPLQSVTEGSKPVPPTHPLSTGEHSTPQEAVPQNKDAAPAPGPPWGGAATTSDTAGANDTLKSEPEKLGAAERDVSPPVSTVDNADAPKSGAVSAISNEQPRTDGVVDDASPEGGKAGETTAAEQTTQAPAPAAATNATTTATDAAEPAPVATKENIPPQTNGATPATPSSAVPPTDAKAPPATDSTTADTKPATADEKMPTMEEPPPIKTVRAAPGMSATSGPLEDFPEGGDVKDQ